MAGELHQALATDQFVLYYQPLVQFQDGLVRGLEAQVYWRHPVQGLLPRPEFLPLAEEAGLALPLGEWVVRQVCRDFKAWATQGLTVPRVSLNLSARQFRDPRLAKGLRAIVREADLDPRHLGVAITEDAVMEDPEKAIAVMSQWCSAGVETALDEFGAGSSSVSYLKKLPLDVLKIAPLLVRNCHANADDGAWVRAIIDMTHELGVQVVAVGVDSEEQYTFLRLSGCDAYQGAWAGVPLPAAECKPYLVPLVPPTAAAP